VPGLDPRVLGRNGLEDALPEVVGVDEDVRLVRHHDLRLAARLRELEGVADDPLDSFAGVDVDLGRHLVRSVLLEVAAHHHVEPFRVLAEDDEVHVRGLRVLQRAELLVEETHGPVVHVEVELEAHPEEDVGGVAVVGDARVAHRAEEDRVEALRQELEAARRQRLAGLEVAFGTPVERRHTDLAAGGVRDRGERPDRFRYDLDADPVAGDDRDAEGPGRH
jgi:hypothetical protein